MYIRDKYRTNKEDQGSKLAGFCLNQIERYLRSLCSGQKCWSVRASSGFSCGTTAWWKSPRVGTHKGFAQWAAASPNACRK